MREGRLEPPSAHAPAVPAALDALVMAAIAADPARRPPLGELVAALRAR